MDKMNLLPTLFKRFFSPVILLFFLPFFAQNTLLADDATVTWILNVGTATRTQLFNEGNGKTTPENLKGIKKENIKSDESHIDAVNNQGQASADKGDKTFKLNIYTGQDNNGQGYGEEGPTEITDKYVLFTFKIEDNYVFTPDLIYIPVANVGACSWPHLMYKAVLSDAENSISATHRNSRSDAYVQVFQFENPDNISFKGDVTLQLYAWTINWSNNPATDPLVLDSVPCKDATPGNAYGEAFRLGVALEKDADIDGNRNLHIRGQLECTDPKPVLTSESYTVCENSSFNLTVTEFASGATLSLYKDDNISPLQTQTNVTTESCTFTIEDGISETTRYRVIAEKNCESGSDWVTMLVGDALKLTPLVPELTFTYDALRTINGRSYESARHTMPLAIVTFPEGVNTSTVNYEVKSVDLQRGANSVGLADVPDMVINKTNWLVVGRKTDTGVTLMADFAGLREAIFRSSYSIVPDGDPEGGCPEADATHIHRGDTLLVNLRVSIGNSNSDNNCPLEQELTIPIRITDKYHVAYIVRGNVLGDFREVCWDDVKINTGQYIGKTFGEISNTYGKTFADLYDGCYDLLKEHYEVTAVNAWAEFDTLNYKPFDLIVFSDFPTVGSAAMVDPHTIADTDVAKGPEKDHPYFINEMFSLVGMRPIFSWKSFFTRDNTPRWKVQNGGILNGLPIQPNWNNYWGRALNKDANTVSAQLEAELLANGKPVSPETEVMDSLTRLHVICDHAVFRDLEFDGEKDIDGNYDIKILSTISTDGSSSRVGMQGFVQDSLGADIIPITTLWLPKYIPDAEDETKNRDMRKVPGIEDGTAELFSCVEWQKVAKARFMIFAVYKDAIGKINDNGKKVIIASIDYLLDANVAHVEDCSYVFDNGYDYYYVERDQVNRKDLEDEYGSEHVFDVYDDELPKYRVRYERANYDSLFIADSTAFKIAQEELGSELNYPFERHDNKWRNKANWLQHNFPSKAHNVRLRSTAHLDSATYEVSSVRINNRVAKLHIEPTGGLKASGKFEHYDGAKSYNERFSLETDTLLYIHSDNTNTGMLAHRHGKDDLNGNFSTPLHATVDLYSAAHYEYDPDYDNDPVWAYKWWTYFGMPVQSGTVPDIFYMAYTYEWDESINDWHRRGDGEILTSWKGYALSQHVAETFHLPGQLQYANDTTLYLSYHPWDETTKTGGEGANIIGYSWTAPLHLDSIRFPQNGEDYNAEIHDLKNVDPIVYIYNTGRDEGWWKDTIGNGTVQNTHDRPYWSRKGIDEDNSNFHDWQIGYWYGIPLEPTQLKDWPADLKVVPAMNAFMVMAKPVSGLTDYEAENEKASIRLDYNRMVYNPVALNTPGLTIKDEGEENSIDNNANNTPRKVRQAEDDQPLLMRIIVSDGYTLNNVFLIQDDSFTEGYDLGWESEYTGGTDGLWVYSSHGDLFTAAFPTLDGRVLGFKAAKDDEYQFSFGDWKGDKLYLNDSKLRRSTVIAKSQTYRFEASKDDETNRFFISSVPYDIQTPTGVEDLVVADGELQVNNPTGERLTVTVYDAAGRMFSRTVTTDPLTQVNLPEGATGVYLVSVEGQQNSFVRKVIR